MSPAVTIVLLDANILYSRTLRDWIALLQIEAPGLFSVSWTEDIMAETLYNLRKEHPLWADEQIGGMRRRLEKTFTGGQIAGYEIDATLHYPDVCDAHVHAAAVHGGVDIVVTANAKDFPDSDDLPYEIYHPDDFLVLVDDGAPTAVRSVTEQQLVYFHGRASAGDGVDLPHRLKNADAPEFATRVRKHLQRINMSILSASDAGEDLVKAQGR